LLKYQGLSDFFHFLYCRAKKSKTKDKIKRLKKKYYLLSEGKKTGKILSKFEQSEDLLHNMKGFILLNKFRKRLKPSEMIDLTFSDPGSYRKLKTSV
jgi:hypothetical protein